MKLLFSRKEYKYKIPMHLFSSLMERVSEMMEPDPYNGDQKSYNVRSLYFDSLARDFYFQKIDGYPYRRKVRLRTYSDIPDKEPVFLEVKNKYVDWIFKQRTHLKSYKKMIESGYHFNMLSADDDLVEQCVYLQKIYGLRPSILVSYQRAAFLDSKYDFKISFDWDIKSSESRDFWLPNDQLTPVLRGYFILELKFNQMVPEFFPDLVREFDLQRMTYSKYTCSIDAALAPKGIILGGF